MSTAVEDVLTHALSTQDMNALRQADDVHAHYGDGEHYLLAVKRLTAADRERNPFVTADPIHRIPVNGTIILHGSNDHMEQGYANVARQFGWGNGIIRTLKAGDRLMLQWEMGGGTHQGLRDINWEGDELGLVVYRAADTFGRKPLKFLASVYVGPKNANRMCRGY